MNTAALDDTEFAPHQDVDASSRKAATAAVGPVATLEAGATPHTATGYTAES